MRTATHRLLLLIVARNSQIVASVSCALIITFFLTWSQLNNCLPIIRSCIFHLILRPILWLYLLTSSLHKYYAK